MEQASKIVGYNAVTGTALLGSNQSGMRAYNERLVLSLIRQTGAMAKVEIARKTGLSAQTVSVIMRSLESDGLLQRSEPVRGKVGQPSVPMGLASNGAFFFGLQVGRRSLDLILTDFLGEIKQRVRVSHPYPTPDNTVSFATDAISQILGQLTPEQQSRVAGLGIAMPFQLWDWAETLGVDSTEMQDWRTRDIAAEIRAAWDFPVFVCNDASTACGAELVFGDQDKPRDFLYFFVGFFVGGGLVLDNTVYTGRTGNAAALGSMSVPAPDGSMHQLVDIASLAILENALVAKGEESTMVWDTPASWNVPVEALEAWLSEAANGIAHAILSSVCLIDVNHVLVDGWMPVEMRTELVRRIQRDVSTFSAAGIEIPIVSEGSIGLDARVLGAASLPLSERFLIERKSFLKGPAQ